MKLNRDLAGAGRRTGAGAKTGGGVGRWAPGERSVKSVKKPFNFILTFGSESVLISDITNFNELAVGCGVAVAALHNLSFTLCTRILQVTLLICPDSIRCFVTVVRNGR